MALLQIYDRLFGNLDEELKAIPTEEKIEITKKAVKAIEELNKNK